MSRKALIWTGLVLALVLGGFVSYYASSNPDGLEKVAEDVGFIDSAEDSVVADSPVADYGVAGVENERVSVGIAGILGVLVTFAVAGGIFIAIGRSNRGAGSSSVKRADSVAGPGS